MGGHAKHEHGHTPEVHGHVDAWHHHDPSSEGIPQGEHAGVVSTSTVSAWLAGITVIVLATVIGMLGYFGLYLSPLRAQTEEREAWARLAQPANEYKQGVLASQGDPGRGSSDGKIVPPAMGMDRAMDQTIARYQRAK